MTRPLILDLFCCAGGAAVGYHRAGFDVVGVDNRPQPHYPFRFIQADAMTFPLDGYDAIHASPPCQRYSSSTSAANRPKHPDLLGPIRARLERQEAPWVIENVPGAPLRADYRLCGCMFQLPHLKRVRYFEVSWGGFALSPGCVHIGGSFSPVGHGTPSGTRKWLGRNVTIAELRAAMGIDWMNRDELSQAIPPAYTEYIGAHLLRIVQATREGGAA